MYPVTRLNNNTLTLYTFLQRLILNELNHTAYFRLWSWDKDYCAQAILQTVKIKYRESFLKMPKNNKCNF